MQVAIQEKRIWKWVAGASVAAVVQSLAASAQGAVTTYTTTAASPTDWNAGATSWTKSGGDAPLAYPDRAGDIARITTGKTVTLTADAVVGQVFRSTSGSASSIASGGGTLTLDNTDGSPNDMGGSSNALLANSAGSGGLTVHAPVVFKNTDLDVGIKGGASSFTLNGAISNAGDTGDANAINKLRLRNDNTSVTVTLAGSVGATGAQMDIENIGTGGGGVTISGSLGASVRSLTQNSETSMVTLSAANAYTGGTTISSGVLQVQNSGTLGTGAVAIASSGTLRFNYTSSGTRTFANAVSGAGGIVMSNSASAGASLRNPTFSGGIAFSSSSGTGTVRLIGFVDQNIGGTISSSNNAFNLDKVGTAKLTLSGTNGGGFATRLTGGNLVLDYAASESNKLSDTNSLVLRGGTLTLHGGEASFTETVGSTTIESNATTIINRTGSGTTTLELNSLTRNRGGVIHFAAPGIATTNQTNSNGILSGSSWATVGTLGDVDWATNETNANDGSIIRYTGYTDWITGAKGNTTNYRLTGTSSNTSDTTLNTLKIDTTGTGQSLTVNSNLTFGNGAGRFGGVLFVGEEDYTINGSAQLRSASITGGGDFIVQQWGAGDLTINAVIGQSSSGGILIKAGPGTLVLGSSNVYTGLTYITQGVLSISSNANLGAEATGATVALNDGTLRATEGIGLYNGTEGTNNRNIVLGGGGGTLEVASTKTLTVGGVISDHTSNNATGSLTKTGAGTLALLNANTYTGPTLISAGTLMLAATGSLAAESDVKIASAGTLAGNGTVNGAALVEGTLAPGASEGKLTFGSTLALSGTTALEIEGISRGVDTGYDAVDIGSDLTYGGALTLNFQNLSAFSNGQVFDLFAIAGTQSGNLSSVLVSGFYGGAGTLLNNNAGTWSGTFGGQTLSFAQATGDLTVTAVPEPASLGGLALLGAALIRRRRA